MAKTASCTRGVKIEHERQTHALTATFGIVSVSPNYVNELSLRCQAANPVWLRNRRTRVIPFAASPRDLEIAYGRVERARIPRDKEDGGLRRKRWSDYASFHLLLCRALAFLRNESSRQWIKCGSSFMAHCEVGRTGSHRHLAEIAHESGVGDLIEERPSGISYRRSLELLQEAMES